MKSNMYLTVSRKFFAETGSLKKKMRNIRKRLEQG